MQGETVVNIPGTPLSSTESEKYMEAQEMARGIGIDDLLTEIDMPQTRPHLIWGDNRISVELAKDARAGSACAHFSRRISFTQDCYNAGIYKPMHLTTNNNPMDFFGKLVTAAKHRSSCNYLMNLAAEVPPTDDDIARAKAAYEALRDGK